MRLEIASLCDLDSPVRYSERRVLSGDTGSLQLSASELFDSGYTPSGSCNVAVALKRVRYGAVPAAFGGSGWAVGVERRVVTFVSTD